MKKLLVSGAIAMAMQCANAADSAAPLSPSVVQSAIDNAGSSVPRFVKELKKRQTVDFAEFSYVLRALIVRPEQSIALDAMDRRRRDLPTSAQVEAETFPANRIRIYLSDNARDLSSMGAKWVPPGAHMELVLDGRIVQPSWVTADPTDPLMMGPWSGFRAWFTFDLPSGISPKSAALVLISSDGKKRKEKSFSADLLFPPR